MDRAGIIEVLEQSTAETQYKSLQRAVRWLADRFYLEKAIAERAEKGIAWAQANAVPMMLIAVGMMLVPSGWTGNVSFGRGVNRAVLFGPHFMSESNEPPIEAEHDLAAVALAIAAIQARS
ncbi:MAG TPA: hypothetical protein VMU85_08960 [Stellaceae bacterium]|nr:hypothetical protein [Stellaceae bacterium]